MITFIAPTTGGFFAAPTEFTVDINPSVAKQVAMLEKSAADFPLEQARADGANAVKEVISFNIINLTTANVIALDGYFNSLKGTTPIDLIFPGTGTVTANVAGTNGLNIRQRYRILTAGGINWTAIGAASGAVGTSFYYNGVTTTGATGTVRTAVKKTLVTSWATSIDSSKFGAISVNGKLVRI
jgi:hypothetical protein